MATDEIQAVLELEDSQWTAGIRRAGDNLRRFQDEVGKSFKDMEKAAANPFGNLAAGIASLGLDRLAGQLKGLAASIVSPFIAAGTAATNFEAEMRNVNSVAQLSEADFASFQDTVSSLGKELQLGVGPAEAAAGAYDIVSAGFTDAADAEAILSESLRGAKAGITSTAVASDLLTTAISAYGLQAKDAARVNDVLFQTVASGKTTYQELAQSFGQVATIAAQNGVSLEELGASIALLTQRGLKTPEAINSIKAAIVQLGSPTEEAIKAQKAFGLNINQTAIKQKGLIAVLNEVTAATKGNTTAQRQILGDVTALNAALGLTSDGGTKFVEVLGAMEGSSGATDKALQQQQKSLKANLDKFTAALELAGVVATQTFLPALTAIVQVGTSAVDFFSALPKPVIFGITVIGGLTAGMVALAAGALAVTAGLASAISAVVAIAGSAAATALAVEALAGGIAFAVEAVVALEAVLAAISGGLLGVSAVVVAAGVALLVYTEILKENTRAEEEALKIDEARAKALRENKGLFEQTAEEILKSGKGSKDLVAAIGGLQDQLTAARRTGNKDLIANLEGQIRDAQSLKKEVTQLEGTMEGAAGAATTLNQTIAGAAAERKDALAEEIHAINMSNQSDREKAASLQALIGMFRLEGDERRRIETDVARLRKKAQDEEEKGVQSVFTAQVRLLDVRIEGWKKDLAAGKDVSKQLEADIRKRTQLEIDGIRARTQAALDAEPDPGRRAQIQNVGVSEEKAARMKGNQEVAAAQKSADDEATRRAKERVDAEVQKNKLEQEGIDTRLAGLEREAQLGRDNAAEQAKLIQQKTELEAQAIKARAEQEAREAKDPGAKAAILGNADAEVANLRKQTELDLQELARDTADRKIASASTELGLVKQIKDAQVDALKQQAAAGKNVTEQLRKALLDRLALQEQEIRLNAEAAKAATNSASEQALIEQDAQTKIIAARVAARKEINETISALEKQKAAQDSLSGVGDTQSLDEFIKSQADIFGAGAARKRANEQQAANRSSAVGRNVSGLSERASDVLDAASGGPFPNPGIVSSLAKTPDQSRTVAQRQKAQADIQAQSAVRAAQQSGGGVVVSGRIVVGVDPNNGQIEINDAGMETTANGRGSRLELVAGTLSPRSNVGGP